MKRWVYFASLAAMLIFLASAEASLISEDLTWFLMVALIPLAVIWGRRINSQMAMHEFRRTYGASRDATCNALCGALAYLDYTIVMRDPTSGRVQFKGGKLGPWIGRFGLHCTATVGLTADGESEIVIAGRASREQKGGQGFLIFPERLDLRVERILDRVQATVVTDSMLESAWQGRTASPESG
jgi:hypothetical protein